VPETVEVGANLTGGGVSMKTVPGFVPDPVIVVVKMAVITLVPVYCSVIVTYPSGPVTVTIAVVG
jgi:hypothetical protein